ncbi:ABC transporter ATP-binding protein [Falsiroseomonas sp. E2-1-a20]|uniref:ABC transporter ATP-binding protein n=1 Tax=Falsiroseomonas sp. E2-1-a20 TaxID=3239300 RepID=UPI003F3DE746
MPRSEHPPALDRVIADPALPSLVVDQVSKQFGETRVLDRTSFTALPGELLALVGPSGCGKSVLLRALAGLDPADSGRIAQDGQDVTFRPAASRDAGWLIQRQGTPPGETVSGSLDQALRGRAWPRPRRQQRVQELLSLLQLAEEAARAPAQLSAGQAQRLALGRALAAEPGLLLLDDPLSAQDAPLRRLLRQELRALQRRLGTTTILATQDQEMALAMADRVLVMARGRIVQDGTPEAVYRMPASAFVAGFLGRGSHFDGVVEAPPGMVLAAGHLLPCRAARPLLFGTPVQCFVRPEDVRIGQAALALPGRFQAVVAQVEFRGPAWRLFLEAGRLRLEADVPSVAPPAPGEVLCVALPADRLLAFPFEP